MDSETIIDIEVVRKGETGQLEVEIVVSIAGKRSYRKVERLSGHDIRSIGFQGLIEMTSRLF